MSLLLAALIAQAASPPVSQPSCAGGLIAVAAGELCPALLFFDSSKAEINRDAARVLDEVVATWKAGGFSRLLLDGHSDLSGTAGANLRMGGQRAEAVKVWLTGRGVPGAAIAVRSLGQTKPIVATADGVSEPQNRRVEVRLEP